MMYYKEGVRKKNEQSQNFAEITDSKGTGRGDELFLVRMRSQ